MHSRACWQVSDLDSLHDLSYPGACGGDHVLMIPSRRSSWRRLSEVAVPFLQPSREPGRLAALLLPSPSALWLGGCSWGWMCPLQHGNESKNPPFPGILDGIFFILEVQRVNTTVITCGWLLWKKKQSPSVLYSSGTAVQTGGWEGSWAGGCDLTFARSSWALGSRCTLCLQTWEC